MSFPSEVGRPRLGGRVGWVLVGGLLTALPGCGGNDPVDNEEPSPVTITTTALPDAVQNEDYGTHTLSATGGDGAFTWTLASGSGALPTGLTLSALGVISGTPTTPGDFDFMVRATSGTLTDEQDLSISVSPQMFTVTVDITSSYNEGTVAGDVTPVIDCSSVLIPDQGTYEVEGTCEADYTVGTVLTLSASGVAYSFLGWDVPGCEPTGMAHEDPCTFTVDADRTVAVTFSQTAPPDFLGIFGEGDGDGTVTSQSQLTPYVDCEVVDGSGDPACETLAFGYPSGTQVTLTAAAADGSGFVGWEDPAGDPFTGCETPDPCTVEMAGDVPVHARFVKATVESFLTMTPSVVAPDHQATTSVAVSTHVRNGGGGLQGAAVVFSTDNGCFEWDAPLTNVDETVAYSTFGGFVSATGHACETDPGPGNDPRFRVRLAGTDDVLRGYLLPIADTLPATATISVSSGDGQNVACGTRPGSFVVQVTDGGGSVVGAPVTWQFGNTFANRTELGGMAQEGWGESPSCGQSHTTYASILTESGTKSVSFTVDVGPGPAQAPGRGGAGGGGSARPGSGH